MISLTIGMPKLFHKVNPKDLPAWAFMGVSAIVILDKHFDGCYYFHTVTNGPSWIWRAAVVRGHWGETSGIASTLEEARKAALSVLATKYDNKVAAMVLEALEG